jgi:hypothetical protein
MIRLLPHALGGLGRGRLFYRCTTEKCRLGPQVGLALGLLTAASLAQFSPASSGDAWFLRKRHRNHGRYQILPNTGQAIRLRCSVRTPCPLKLAISTSGNTMGFLYLYHVFVHLTESQQLLSPLAQAKPFPPPRSITYLTTSAPLLVRASAVSCCD